MLSFGDFSLHEQRKVTRSAEGRAEALLEIKTEQELDSRFRGNDELGGFARSDDYLSGSRFRRSATALGSGLRTGIEVHREYRLAMDTTQAQATRLALTADEADDIFYIDVKQPLATFGTFAMVDHLRLPVARMTQLCLL